MDNFNGPGNKVEILDHIFMADKGSIKILLLKKETEPYKGYWSLPRGILKTTEEVENQATMISYDLTGIKDIEFQVNAIFSELDRIGEERVLGISCIALTDSVTVSLKQEEKELEFNWFDIKNLPKMVYDHTKVATEAIDDLQKILEDITMIKKLFPSDFTLPELQKVYEQVQNQELDRRNFRKKLMSLDILEPTGEHNMGESGRPAKLYRFKDKIEN